MPIQYVAYIDEAGDTGLENIKPVDKNGASEWLVLSCALVPVEYDTRIVGLIKFITSQFKNNQSPYIHFKDLIPVKKRIACEAVADFPCAAFVVMSNKKNIRRYKNHRLDDGNKAWIYWWLTRLLLERVTKHVEILCKEQNIKNGKLSIIFSRRGRMRYADFSSYLNKLYRQSRANMLVLDAGDLTWSVIDFEEVYVLDHKARAGLQLADIIASAFFTAVERNRPAECDPIYAKILKPRMARKPS